MPLTMSRPWKHPSSGVYWLRKGVPEELRALLGKREKKRSLRTKDPRVRLGQRGTPHHFRTTLKTPSRILLDA
jgi:hypothetical protein